MESKIGTPQLEPKSNGSSSEFPTDSLDIDEEKSQTPAAVTPTSTNAFPPPPNGGTLAWLQVFGTGCLWMSTM